MPPPPRLADRQFDIVITKPLERLPDAPRLTELPEHQVDRLLHPLVRVLDYLPPSVRM